ncbi:MAG TPA: DUF2169 domain-containing protein [Gemmobacter sp.]|nr:DUF2169 domain-containing protein [Gemmobacter sp.]
MQYVSHIALPGFAFQQYNPKMELTGCVTVSALFDIGRDGACHPAAEQPSIRLADEMIGPETGAPETPPQELRHQADFVPCKPATDVTVLARAVSPSGAPEASWLCGLRGAGLEALLRVHGPRLWQCDPAGRIQPGPAQPVTDLALSWRHAWGGREIDADGQLTGEVDAQNPLGAGFARVGAEHALIGLPAPQIEAAYTPITDGAGRGIVPAGLAPVAPVSAWRSGFAGTYDSAWQRTRHPFLPKDFDTRFYHCAPPALRSASWLRGDETFELLNLHPAARHLRMRLPGRAFGAVASYRSGASLRQPLALDGVHFDLLGATPQLRLTWRTSFLWLSGIRQIDLGDLQFDSLHAVLPGPAYAG